MHLLANVPHFYYVPKEFKGRYNIHSGQTCLPKGGLFMNLKTYVSEVGNKGGRGPLPLSIFDHYDKKTLYLVMIGFKMPRL